jgi:hypothetical protein
MPPFERSPMSIYTRLWLIETEYQSGTMAGREVRSGLPQPANLAGDP